MNDIPVSLRVARARDLLEQAQAELAKAAQDAKTASDVPEWVADFLNRRVKVENYLFQCASGVIPLPDQAKCRELALQLGVPESFGKGKQG